MASNSLRGLGGQRHTPYNLRTNELSKATCKVSTSYVYWCGRTKVTNGSTDKKGAFKYMFRYVLFLLESNLRLLSY